MKKMKIYYTSDVHGYLYPTDYLSNEAQGMGLMQAITDFDKDENTLVIDGGDIFQGSPFINYFQNQKRCRSQQGRRCPANRWAIHLYAQHKRERRRTIHNHGFRWTPYAHRKAIRIHNCGDQRQTHRSGRQWIHCQIRPNAENRWSCITPQR